MELYRFWHVEYYNRITGDLEHNAICRSFNELCQLAQGRIFVITGESDPMEYAEYKNSEFPIDN